VTAPSQARVVTVAVTMSVPDTFTTLGAVSSYVHAAGGAGCAPTTAAVDPRSDVVAASTANVRNIPGS
jgi:hypothetical protein